MPNDIGAAPAATRESAAVIAAVVGVAEKKAAGKKAPPNASLLPGFIRQYFSGMPAEELKSRTPEALYETAATATGNSSRHARPVRPRSPSLRCRAASAPVF